MIPHAGESPCPPSLRIRAIGLQVLFHRGEVRLDDLLDELETTDRVVKARAGDRTLTPIKGPDGTSTIVYPTRRRLLWIRLSLTGEHGARETLHVLAVRLGARDGVPDILRTAIHRKHYLAQLAPREKLRAWFDVARHCWLTRQAMRSPHPWFDADWYAARAGIDNHSPVDSFLHYLTSGWRRELDPHPRFGTLAYLAENLDALAALENPLIHHTRTGGVHACPPTSPMPQPPIIDSGPLAPKHEVWAEVLPAQRRRAQRPDGPNQIAVVVCTTDGYDQPLPPAIPSNKIDYHLYTDSVEHDHAFFQQHALPPLEGLDSTRRNRWLKLHLHRVLSDYKIVVYVDANVHIRCDLLPYLKDFERTGKALAFLPHPFRDCIYEEGACCALTGLDNPETIATQLRRYRIQGSPRHNGLTENNLFALRTDHPDTRRFFELWWREYANGSRRDQISAGYAFWATGIKPHPLLGPGRNTRNHRGFALYPHDRDRARAPLDGDLANTATASE